MQITKLRLFGFKSFIEPTEFLIDAGLTGIVGPNGCGKSNLIDALRWAMGESSARGLRGGEMEHVIFAGTAARPAFDLAEVALHLQNVNGSLPALAEFDEVELARRIGRGAGSAYRVNGKELRARDVQLLFADAASGARSAAIVNQGEIGALVEAKPAERRRLLEDAAGVGGLQARRHEAELKLRAADTNLTRVEDLLVTLDEQHRALRKQAHQAKRYRELSASHRDTEAALLIGQWRCAQGELEEAEAALEESRSHIDVTATGFAHARGERDRLGALTAKLRASEAELATELVRLTERLSALRDETTRVDVNRARLVERQEQIARDAQHAEVALEDAGAMLARLETELAALTESTDERTQQLELAQAVEVAAAQALLEAEGELRQALAGAAEIEAQIKQLELQREARERERQSIEAALTAAAAEQAELGAVVEPSAAATPMAEAEAELSAAMAAVEQTESGLTEADQERDASRTALAQAEAFLKETQERLQLQQVRERQAQMERSRLVERRDELQTRIEELNRRRQELEARIEQAEKRRTALDLAAVETRLQTTEAACAGAEAEIEAKRGALETAAQEEERQRAEAQSLRAILDRLRAETDALAELAEPGMAGDGMIDLVDVQGGYDKALAAALGDDLIGGSDPGMPTHWRESGKTSSKATPALPKGCKSLGDFVSGPPALHRRLAQIGVVDAAKAAKLQSTLAQGQRLVSLDGGLWRWDGFVRLPDALPAETARLQQQTHRRQLATELAEHGERCDALERALATAAARAAGATADLNQALEAGRTARTGFEAAKDALAEARAADAAFAAELEALAAERERAAAERKALELNSQSLARQIADLEATDSGRETAEADQLPAAEAAHAGATEADAAAASRQSAARTEAAAARQRLADARRELENYRTSERTAEAAVRERERRSAEIETALARLEEQRGALEQRTVADAETAQRLEVGLAAAQQQLADAEAALTVCRQQHGAAGTEHAELRHRQTAAQARSISLAQERELWSERLAASQGRRTELADRRTAVDAELTRLNEEPDTLSRQQAELKAGIAEIENQRAAATDEIATADAALADAQASLDRAEAQRLETREQGARFEARLERAQAECQAAENAVRARHGQCPAETTDAPPTMAELEELEAKLARIGASRERLGPVNLRAIEEAAELATKIENLQTEQEELTRAIERFRRAIAALNREGRERLRAAFVEIEKHFEALFVRLFGGGRAKLSLTDLEDPFAAGLELAASPPGKKLQSLSLLSGGEKALTALALIFAVFLTRPAPLCILDEVDAPLDDANVERLGVLLEELAGSTETRFIVVTHNPLTMAKMDRLYGVTMVERGISQLVGVDLRRAVELRATA